LVAYDTVIALNKAHEEGNKSKQSNLELQSRQLDETIALLKAKKITQAQAEKMVRAINERFDRDSERTWNAELYDTGIEALKGFKETLKGITPPPVQTLFGYLGL